MNLNNLKPAWQRFRLLNSMQQLNHDEIFLMIDSADDITRRKVQISITSIIMFIVLTICCQGG